MDSPSLCRESGAESVSAPTPSQAGDLNLLLPNALIHFNSGQCAGESCSAAESFCNNLFHCYTRPDGSTDASGAPDPVSGVREQAARG